MNMLLMHEIKILWYRGVMVLDSIAEPRVFATCDGHDFTHWCIVVKSDCRFFDITRCIGHDGSFLSREAGLRIIITNCKGECNFQIEIELSTSWKPAGNMPRCVSLPKGALCKKECRQLLRKVCCNERRASKPCNCKQDNGNDPGLNWTISQQLRGENSSERTTSFMLSRY